MSEWLDPFIVSWELPFRIVLAAFMGGMLGVERDLHARAAGLRTSMMVAIGSCLFTIVSAYGFQDVQGNLDPSRIAAQIVVGIGFLGAGVLIKNKEERSILGLTTAANIWVVAALGMSAGAGLYGITIITFVLALIVLTMLRPLSRWLDQVGIERARRGGKTVIEED